VPVIAPEVEVETPVVRLELVQPELEAQYAKPFCVIAPPPMEVIFAFSVRVEVEMEVE
jgi:hypothetical protein